MKTYPAVITKVPKVGKSFIIGEASVDGEKIPVVAFNNLPNAVKQSVLALEADQSIYLKGRIDLNAKMGKRFIIEQVDDAAPQEQAPVEIIPVEERVMPDRKYSFVDPRTKQKQEFWSDGIYAWREGQKDNKAKLTYSFVENYNNLVTADKWLMPDWYAIEMAKKMQEDKLQIKLMEEFAIY
jgi:hypothetical protein